MFFHPTSEYCVSFRTSYRMLRREPDSYHPTPSSSPTLIIDLTSSSPETIIHGEGLEDVISIIPPQPPGTVIRYGWRREQDAVPLGLVYGAGPSSQLHDLQNEPRTSINQQGPAHIYHGLSAEPEEESPPTESGAQPLDATAPDAWRSDRDYINRYRNTRRWMATYQYAHHIILPFKKRFCTTPGRPKPYTTAIYMQGKQGAWRKIPLQNRLYQRLAFAYKMLQRRGVGFDHQQLVEAAYRHIRTYEPLVYVPEQEWSLLLSRGRITLFGSGSKAHVRNLSKTDCRPDSATTKSPSPSLLRSGRRRR